MDRIGSDIDLIKSDVTHIVVIGMRTVEGAHQAHERILQYTVDGSCGKGEAPMDPAKRRLLDSHAGWVIARAESSGRESSWNRPMATRREGHYFPR